MWGNKDVGPQTPSNQTRSVNSPKSRLSLFLGLSLPPSLPNFQNHETALTKSIWNCLGSMRVKPKKLAQDASLVNLTSRSTARSRRSSVAAPPSQHLSLAQSTPRTSPPPQHPIPIFRKECLLDHLNGLDPHSTPQLRSRIGCPQACRAWITVSILVAPTSQFLGVNWSRNLTLSISLVQALRS